MSRVIVPSIEQPEGNHLSIWVTGEKTYVFTVGPRGGQQACAVVSLADLAEAIEKAELPRVERLVIKVKEAKA